MIDYRSLEKVCLGELDELAATPAERAVSMKTEPSQRRSCGIEWDKFKRRRFLAGCGEVDRLNYSGYEQELFERHPHI